MVGDGHCGSRSPGMAVEISVDQFQIGLVLLQRVGRAVRAAECFSGFQPFHHGAHVFVADRKVASGIENDGIELKYGQVQPSESNFSDELLTVKLRYKEPDGDQSRLLTMGLLDKNNAFESASENLRFASAVAGFGMLLRDSNYKGNVNFNEVWQIANSARGNDLKNYRTEFVELVEKARRMKG